LFTDVHEFVFRRSIKRSTPGVSRKVQLSMASDKILETKLGWGEENALSQGLSY
jgi:hypothetical protein